MRHNSLAKCAVGVAMCLMGCAFGLVPRAHAAGVVWTWGDGSYGQLGNGSYTSSNVPAQVKNLSSDVIAVAGGLGHSLALKSDGSVWAWGGNTNGQLGNGSTTGSNVPVQVSNLSGVIAIACGAYHSLAVKSDGSVWAWGDNTNGQLGNGNGSYNNAPVPVSKLGSGSGVIAVAGGANHSLALTSGGDVWAWGSNFYGQLGNGSYTGSNVPVLVHVFDKAIACGGDQSMAAANLTLWTWGYFTTGNGTHSTSNKPVASQYNFSGAVPAAGYTHQLVVNFDGSVWAWGDGSYGQLGNGKNGFLAGSGVPQMVSSLSSGVSAVAGGYGHSLALKSSDGSVWAWGLGSSGQLGTGSTVQKLLPTAVSDPNGQGSFMGALAIACGYNHSLAIRQNAPTITSITPNSGSNNGSVNITNLAGTGFLPNATVKLVKSGVNGLNATNVTVVSSTQITCTFDLSQAWDNNANAPAIGQCDVVVTNPDNQSGTLAKGFTINNMLTLKSIVPNTGTNNGTVGFQVAGTGILPNPTVKLIKSGQKDIIGTGIYLLPPPPGAGGTFDLTGAAAGQWDVVVINTDNTTATLLAAFTITNAAPKVTSITPSFGSNNGPVNITNLAGTGFLAGASVKLSMNGTDIGATNVVVVNSTTITCTFDLTGKTTGQYDVVVTNPDNQSGTLAKGFTVNPPSAHDVAVTSFTASPNPVSGGQTVTFSITLKNLGTSNESGVTFKVTTTVLNRVITIIGPIKIATWKAGQELSGSVKIPVPKNTATGDYLITAQLSTVMGEVNIDNNKQTLKLTIK